MKRGDIVIAASRGDYGKPRPHVVVQSERLGDDISSFILCPITSVVRNISFRLPLPAHPEFGLRRPSEVMVDKLQAVRHERISIVIGRLDPETMSQLDAMLIFVLGLSRSHARTSE